MRWFGMRLQFLSPPLLEATVERLHAILRPDSSLLAFFHADEKAEDVPLYNYRISDEKNLLLTPRGTRKRAQYFNNRGLEKLFQGQTVKFFLRATVCAKLSSSADAPSGSSHYLPSYNLLRRVYCR